jgi:hypothetical protein
VILLRQPEHRADDRKRQVAAIVRHEVGFRPPFQPIEQAIGDPADHRPQRRDRAPLERLIDEAAQPAMLGIVMAEHVQRQKTDRLRQESQDSLLGLASGVGGIAHEVVMVLQQLRAGVVCQGEPGAANNRELHRNHGAFGPHAIELGHRIRVETRRGDVKR